MTRTVAQTPGLQRPGLWLLAVYALLLAVSAVAQQPEVETDFAGCARYIRQASSCSATWWPASVGQRSRSSA